MMTVMMTVMLMASFIILLMLLPSLVLSSDVMSNHHHYLNMINETIANIALHKELCSEELMNYAQECATVNSCKIVRYELDNISVATLVALIDDKILHDSTVKYIVIKNKHQSVDEIGDEFDAYLAVRPWLVMRLLILPGILNHELHQFDHFDRLIVVERLPSMLESNYREVLPRFYPTEDVCNTRPLHLINLLGDAWGNRLHDLSNIVRERQGLTFSVRSTWSGNASGHSSLKPISSTAIVGDNECPDVINKWECLFLKTTNCSLPKEENMRCNSKSCILWSGDTGFYTNAGTDGKYISRDDMSNYTDIFNTFNKHIMPSDAVDNGVCSHFYSNDTYVSKETTHTVQSPYDPSGLKYTFGLFARFNTVFMMEVQHIIDNFRVSTAGNLRSNTSCITLHIRKDDRMIPNTDMIEWCKNNSLIEPNGQTIPGQSTSAMLFYNYGCHLRLPYGAATLEHYLNASMILNATINNLFIMTDDKQWLDDAIGSYKYHRNIKKTNPHLPEYVFHTLPATVKHRTTDNSMISAEFWASLMIAQQCEGLVGFIGASASSNLVRAAMAYHHKHSYLKCPMTYGLGRMIREINNSDKPLMG